MQLVRAEVLDQCPCPQWRAIIALSRFAGLRCPSEIVELLIAKSAVPDPKATAETALSRAARNADVALLRLLLAHGVKIADTPNLARSATA